MSSNGQLAIVIPAFRGRFLHEALSSLANQTDQRFNVYVGDDASNDDLEGIVTPFRKSLRLHYHRFPDNLGATDLMGQWQRCIALTTGEPWLWIFSDDDEASSQCVEGFHEVLSKEKEPSIDVIGFNLEFIDESGAHHHQPAPHPVFENASSLFRSMLTSRSRKWRMPDHVFARAAYERNGGFVRFPMAIYTDCASWLSSAKRGGVRMAPNGVVRWRSYAEGTSSGQLMKHRASFLEGLIQYMYWLCDYANQCGGCAPKTFRQKGPGFFHRELRLFSPPPDAHERKLIVATTANLWGQHRIVSHGRLWGAAIRAKARHWPLLQTLARWRLQNYLR